MTYLKVSHVVTRTPYPDTNQLDILRLISVYSRVHYV